MVQNKILLTFFLSASFSVHLSSGVCRGNGDCSNGATCSPDGANCPDFYTPDTDGCCIQVASYGRRCEQDVQCQAILGPHSRCFLNSALGMALCECYSEDEPVVNYYNGGCYVPRQVGEGCVEDNECILGSNNGSNLLARCEDSVCTCGQNSEISLTTYLNSAGVCVMDCKNCLHVEINLMAIMLLISSFMVVLLYFMCRIIAK